MEYHTTRETAKQRLWSARLLKMNKGGKATTPTTRAKRTSNLFIIALNYIPNQPQIEDVTE